MIISRKTELLLQAGKEFCVISVIMSMLMITGGYIGYTFAFINISNKLQGKQMECVANIRISPIESAEWKGTTTLNMRQILLDNFGNFWYDGI